MPNATTIQQIDIPRAISEWVRLNESKVKSINYVGNVPQGKRTLSDYIIEWQGGIIPTEQDLIAIWNEKIQPIIDNPPTEPEEEEPIEIVPNDPVVNDLFQRVQRIEAQIEQLLSR